MNFQEYVSPELLVLIPVLYVIGFAIKKSVIKDKWIPLILGGISVCLSGLYIFATGEFNTSQEVMTALYTTITQGILIAGTSVYADQIVKQTGKDE